MKIAMVGMSGIRVCDPALIELGLTLPGFVERGEAVASLPSLGLLTLTGMTPREHEVRYFEAASLDEFDEDLGGFDLVAISSMTAQIKEAYALSERVRGASGSRTVIGGLHATVMPDEVLRHADAVVVGDGESVWLDVLRDASRGKLAGVYGDREGRFKLHDAPMPRFDLLDMSKYNRITIQTSRGCPYQCEFCASSILLGPKYRQKPIERVLAELDHVREMWPRPFIEFADDNSFANRAYWRRLLPELRKRRIKWFTETDISIADDPDFLDMLARSGCAEVLIGLESPVREGLPQLEMKADWKLGRQTDSFADVRRIQAHGVRVNGCFIVGLDGHTHAVFDEIERFAREAPLFDVQVTLPTPFPGTPFYRRLEATGRLTHPGAWERCTLFDLNFDPRPMGYDELRTGFHDLVARLYTAEATAARRAGFDALRRRGPLSLERKRAV